MNHNFVDRLGHIYGYLTVEEFSEIRHSKAFWKCRCKCGTIVTLAGKDLASGNTKSCGCYRKELTRRRYLKHGYTCPKIRIPEYATWQNMVNRCHREGASSYRYYGGRGIQVCARWRTSFPDFLEDMGKRPSKGHSLDRIDVDGNYEPSNCKWSTQIEQVNNRRVKKIEDFSDAVIWKEFFKRYLKVIPQGVPTIS